VGAVLSGGVFLLWLRGGDTTSGPEIEAALS
jgi:hypothetical protein